MGHDVPRFHSGQRVEGCDMEILVAVLVLAAMLAAR